MTENVVVKVAAGAVGEVVERFLGLLGAKGVKVFAVIDQAAEARAVGLSLRETVLVVFGNPAAGTPVMDAAPLAALDLPLKVLIWDDGGTTKVAYYSPEGIAERHQVAPETAAGLAAINLLTDVLVH